MFYFVYILFSLKDKKSYVGFTDNLKRRKKEHDDGKVEATRDRRPLDLIYFEGYKNKTYAMKREKYFKTGWGRRYTKNIIKDYLEHNQKN